LLDYKFERQRESC